MTGEKLDEKAIFNVARTIEFPEARAEYLRHACSGHAELIERVQSLLRGYEEQASFLESPPAAIDVERTARFDEPIAERPGTVIGPYKLVEQIGEGGFRAGVRGRSAPARSPQSCPKDHQAGDGHS